ncbi:hypothetical protein QMK17_21575 [Rhodococcus sp. G-MC3]|uniref:hypothetical protein n=1 Tax=Rhodococcus sp. G-MC3 TaxID=3046209 RepID=UPI0024B8D563|nr:hypothetical protein [Rhodococcus sp. G-MC3]MDJ0395913.1 hypothetical protein [Rhodococcus sp. G-MC3]
MPKYNEDERRAYAELAGDIGIRPAMRELGYPSSWASGRAWCTEFGIEVELDELKSKAAQYNAFYNDSEQIIAFQDLIADARAKQLDPDTTAADLERLAKVIKLSVDGIRLIQGKATVNAPAKANTTDEDAEKIYLDFKRDQAGTDV